MNATLFDLLGIAPSAPNRAQAAAALLPDDLLSLTGGINLSEDRLQIVNALDAGTSFSNVRPGVEPGFGAIGQIGFTADMAIVSVPATTQPFYLRSLPNVGLLLKVTDAAHPVRIAATFDSRGAEIIVDRLPVTLQLKAGLASAMGTAEVTVGSFDVTAVDSIAYRLSDEATPAEIDCFVRLHLTPEGDVILEPNVPLSFGPVVWMGLAAKAVYDIQLLPAPNRREYLEWTHNDPGAFLSNPPVKGAIGFRSIDLDFDQAPLSDLRQRVKGGAVHVDDIELVLEDVVVPIAAPMLPIPSHGTFGFRRKISGKDLIREAYSFDAAPIQIPLYGSQQQGGNGGTSLTLEVDNFLFRTGSLDAYATADQPQVQFKTALIFQTASGQKLGPTLGIDSEWTLVAGLALDPATTPVKFEIIGTTVGLSGLAFGVSLSRLGRGQEFKNSFVLTGDLFIKGATPKPNDSAPIFELTSLTGKSLEVVLSGIGWRLGTISLNALQMPDGMQLVFGGVVRIIVEEMGWVEEPNGTPYFSFSGGVAIGKGGGRSVEPNGAASDDKGSGFGIRVRRLRFRLNDDGSQPLFKIDGLFLKLAYGPVDVEGFGYISDFVDSGWAVKEWGFGVKVALDLLASKFSLAATFVKGSRHSIADPSQHFSYFLAALKLGWLPAGPIGLYDISALVADNMAPNLDATFPDGEGMALFKWYQSHNNALTMPASRTLADWIAEKGAFSVGAGCGFSLNGAGGAFHLDIFVMVSKSQADNGILIVGELYLLKNPKPIGFAAIEWDISQDKFGVMVGVELTPGDFVPGVLPGWLADIAHLGGTLYVGNKPWTFAIGQLADQSTWLSLRIDFDKWISAKFVVGVAVQFVEGGPKGFGFIVFLKGGTQWGIGRFSLWGTLGLIVGTWKTGSQTSGLEFWIGLGFKINLFFVFSFGAEINVRLTYLGTHPSFLTIHAEIKIDTPWYLPDVTFTIDKTWQEQLPFDNATMSRGLGLATGIDPTAQQGVPLLVPGLAGGGDAAALYSFNQLNGLHGERVADTHLADIPNVSVDATIAIDLNQPIANDTLIATSTYAASGDLGVQKVQDLTLRYALTSIGIRRAPRYGPTAGVWSDLLRADDTEFALGGEAPQTIGFAWDVDSRADGALSPKRLLVNSSAPYSFIIVSPQNDEEAVRHDPDFPCCDPGGRKRLPRAHVLEFSGLAIGTRTSRSERFSGDGAWWVWSAAIPPAVVPGDPVYPQGHVARVPARGHMLIGVADLPDPASAVQLECAWDRLLGRVHFAAYVGLELVAAEAIDLTAGGDTSAVLKVAADAKAGITRITLRAEMEGMDGDHLPAAPWSPEGAVRILRISYITLADMNAYASAAQHCKNSGSGGPPGALAAGKLAFLPNHDYEIVLTTQVALTSKQQGTRTLSLGEALYFRTKGLPGLNACKNVGDDIRRHVAATYPMRRDVLLYRAEPCVLAFENSLSAVLPVDRVPAAGDPPERAQMLPLQLNVDRVVSPSGLKRMTVPGNDWIGAHRANPYPPIYIPALPLFLASKTRHAPTNDALVLRHDAVRAAVPHCGAPPLDHVSQILLHEPIDAGGAQTRWEPMTGYRATVRQQNGPFAERSRFDTFDLGAFVRQADGGATAKFWSIDAEGRIVAPGAEAGRHYVSCGELDWDHLQVQSRIDLGGAAAAGIAVAVSDGAAVDQAILATVEAEGTGHALVLRARHAGADTELARADVALAGAFLLHVTQFDDAVRAQVGETMVEAPRGALRAGRVALVADGPAAFAGIAIDALDIYAFEFATSSFESFAEHLGSFDGTAGTLSTGALGGTPLAGAVALGKALAGRAAVMASSADPQQRQMAFDALLTDLCIGLREGPLAVSIDRIFDSTGTLGLLLQSPDPISFTRDVALKLTRRTRVWVPGRRLWPFKFDRGPSVLNHGSHLAEFEAARLAALAPGREQRMAADAEALHVLHSVEFSVSGLRLSGRRKLEPNDRIVRANERSDGTWIEVYGAPDGGVARLLETGPAASFTRRSDLGPAALFKPGQFGLFNPHRPIVFGQWENRDVAVPLVALSNGVETAALLLSPTAALLAAGRYTLTFTFDRDRWLTSVPGDPEQHYHDSWSAELTW